MVFSRLPKFARRAVVVQALTSSVALVVAGLFAAAAAWAPLVVGVAVGLGTLVTVLAVCFVVRANQGQLAVPDAEVMASVFAQRGWGAWVLIALAILSGLVRWPAAAADLFGKWLLPRISRQAQFAASHLPTYATPALSHFATPGVALYAVTAVGAGIGGIWGHAALAAGLVSIVASLTGSASVNSFAFACRRAYWPPIISFLVGVPLLLAVALMAAVNVDVMFGADFDQSMATRFSAGGALDFVLFGTVDDQIKLALSEALGGRPLDEIYRGTVTQEAHRLPVGLIAVLFYAIAGSLTLRLTELRRSDLDVISIAEALVTLGDQEAALRFIERLGKTSWSRAHLMAKMALMDGDLSAAKHWAGWGRKMRHLPVCETGVFFELIEISKDLSDQETRPILAILPKVQDPDAAAFYFAKTRTRGGGMGGFADVLEYAEVRPYRDMFRKYVAFSRVVEGKDPAIEWQLRAWFGRQATALGRSTLVEIASLAPHWSDTPKSRWLPILQAAVEKTEEIGRHPARFSVTDLDCARLVLVVAASRIMAMDHDLGGRMFAAIRQIAERLPIENDALELSFQWSKKATPLLESWKSP